MALINEEKYKQALRRQWFAGLRGECELRAAPMTISDEESNLFCAYHLLNCDEGQGQYYDQSQAFGT
jgi:hypothetical protein